MYKEYARKRSISRVLSPSTCVYLCILIAIALLQRPTHDKLQKTSGDWKSQVDATVLHLGSDGTGWQQDPTGKKRQFEWSGPGDVKVNLTFADGKRETRYLMFSISDDLKTLSVASRSESGPTITYDRIETIK